MENIRMLMDIANYLSEVIEQLITYRKSIN